MFKDREFVLRSIMSIFIIAFTLSFIYLFNEFFSYISIFFIGLLMACEWANITNKNETTKNKWNLLGSVYIMLTLIPVVLIKFRLGNHFLMWFILMTWCLDTFAYIIGGKLHLGKTFITKISPKKSYEGLFGGIVMACICCYIFASYYLPAYKNILLLATPILGILEQASDITESYVKRKFNVKDSGTIIPGHGGMLDRFDGFLLSGIAFLIICLVF